MYSEGHIGLTFIIMTLLLIPFGGNETSSIIIVLSALWSTLPDIDMKLRKYGIKHRTITHTVVFAIASGLFFSVVFWFSHGSLRWSSIAFVGGFMGVISHLIGDAFTHHAFKPFLPYSHWEVALHLTSANNKMANEGLLIAGGILFIFYFIFMGGI